MVWLIFAINVLTIIVAFKKRMILYALLYLVFLFLVTGQAFQIQSDLELRHTVEYLNNFISDVGFDLALWYVLWLSCFALALALIKQGYKRSTTSQPLYAFAPSLQFYISLLLFLFVLSTVLIFVVVGLGEFLHSSRPGFQSGTTIFLVLLYLGAMPMLMKILCRGKIVIWDVACFTVCFLVTAGFSRIHLILYLVSFSLAFLYASGWTDRSISASSVIRLCLLATVALLLFFGIGAIHDAQNFVSGSFGDLVDFIVANPEKSLLSIEYNYRIGVEGMSGIAGIFTQYLSHPTSVHYDYGISWLLKGSVQWMPGFLKNYVDGALTFSDELTWYRSSIAPTGPETFFMSFGWSGIAVYPLTVYVLAWYLPLRLLAMQSRPLLSSLSYTLFACCIFFVRGSVSTWIAFSVSYAALISLTWPLFRRQFRAVAPREPA